VSQPQHWTEPGAYPVAAGVHRIPLPLPLDGLRAVNVYVLEHDDGLTLVDGGWAIADSRTRLEWSLKQLGHEVADITRFLVTHVHRDHYTQAVAVRAEFGSHVSLGIGERATLELTQSFAHEVDPTVTQLERAGAEELARDWTRQSRPPLDAELWAPPDTWLTEDHTLSVGSRRLEALATPGHTRGHYVFADLAEGLLFAGDHVLPTITPSIGFELAYAELPLGDFLSSLAKVRALPDLTLLPAHGPVTSSVHARVDELVAHHDDRLALCQQAVAAGCATALEVARDLPWTRRHRRFADLDVFNSALATLETAAHLELLAAQERIHREEHDGRPRYARRDAS